MQAELINKNVTTVTSTNMWISLELHQPVTWQRILIGLSRSKKLQTPCPSPGPLVLSYFASNKNLIRSKPNTYKGENNAQRLDNKMLNNKHKK